MDGLSGSKHHCTVMVSRQKRVFLEQICIARSDGVMENKMNRMREL